MGLSNSGAPKTLAVSVPRGCVTHGKAERKAAELREVVLLCTTAARDIGCVCIDVDLEK